jgi:hypothetical protein
MSALIMHIHEYIEYVQLIQTTDSYLNIPEQFNASQPQLATVRSKVNNYKR